MTEHWHGPQWVLITTWVFMTIMPMFARAAGLNKQTSSDFATQRGIELLSRLSIAFILWWGGFWS